MNLKSLFNKSVFFKNVITLISGTAIAQLVAIGIQPIIRRLYLPEDFGAFAVYLSIVSIVVVFVSLRYEQAIVLPKSDNDAKNIMVFSVASGFFISFILFLIILIFHNSIIGLFDYPEKHAWWFYMLPASFFLLGIYQSINYWLIRQKAFKSSSVNKISRRISEAAVQSGFGALKYSFGLPIGDIVGNIANCVSGIYQIKKKNFNFKNVSWINIKKQVIKYIEFPKFNLLPAILNTLSLTMPVFIINGLYTKELTGYFDLTRLVLALPLALITTSFSQVLYQHISEKRNNKLPILKGLIKQFKILLILALVGVILVFMWGPALFSFVFGNGWEISGVMARILVFSFAVKFIVSPFSIVLIALEKIKLTAIWQLFYFVLISSLFLFRNLEIYTILKYLVVFDLLAYGIYLFLIYFTSLQYDKNRISMV